MNVSFSPDVGPMPCSAQNWNKRNSFHIRHVCGRDKYIENFLDIITIHASNCLLINNFQWHKCLTYESCPRNGSLTWYWWKAASPRSLNLISYCRSRQRRKQEHWRMRFAYDCTMYIGRIFSYGERATKSISCKRQALPQYQSTCSTSVEFKSEADNQPWYYSINSRSFNHNRRLDAAFGVSSLWLQLSALNYVLARFTFI